MKTTKRAIKRNAYIVGYIAGRVARRTARAVRSGVDILAEVGLWAAGFNVGGCLTLLVTGTYGSRFGPLFYIAAGAVSWFLTLLLTDAVLKAYGELRDEAVEEAERRYPEVAPEPGDLALLEE